MVALITYLGGHWTLVIAAVLAVAACGALAFFLRSWKLAVAAIGIAIAGFLYQGSVTDGIKLQMQKDAAAKISMLESHISAIETANAEDTKRALQDADTIAQLQKQIDETPKNDGSCGDLGFSKRMRDFR